MNPLFIQGTNDKPRVELRPEGELSISGLSLPENVLEVFSPILQWLEDYKSMPNNRTTVSFNFEYLNTASTNMVARLIDSISELGTDQLLVIKWHYKYGDYDMKELGEDLLEETNCKFEFIETAA